ncbi:MAG: hypothetical protein ACR2F2_06110, partial [Pyrinomonadaceae bacterium]
MLNIFTLFLSLILFLLVIWIIIPAPASFIWLLAIGAGEWSLWIAIISLLIILSGIFFLFTGGGKLWFVSVIFSLFTLCISLYPFFSSLKAAQNENISLSFGEYFSGLIGDDFSSNNFTTQTFTEVDGKD